MKNKKRLPRNLHSLGYYCSSNLLIEDAFCVVIAIERIFGALKRKFVKDGGYGCIDCQISKRGIQILGVFFAKEISITKHVFIECYLLNGKKGVKSYLSSKLSFL